MGNCLCGRYVGRSLGNRYRGTGTIWLDDLRCTGRETHLFQCGHNGWGVHDCGHYEDVAISCNDIVNSNGKCPDYIECV